MEPEESQPSEEQSTIFYPPKPVLEERSNNAITRSLVSLGIYALLFYMFEQNLAYIAAILVVIIIHELGHFALMRLFNYSNVKIFIIPLLGAFTSGKKQEVSQKQLSLILLAGPVPGIIIGIIILILNRSQHNETLTMLSNTFLIINLFNCLPFHPLDGGRLMETLFFKENFLIRLIFGIISILALLALFLYSLSLLLIIVPVILSIELFNEYKFQKIRDYLRQEKINFHIDYENLSDKNYWLIRDCVLLSFPKKYSAIEPGRYDYHMVEPLIVKQVQSVLQVNLKFDLGLVRILLLIFFYLLIFVVPIYCVLTYK